MSFQALAWALKQEIKNPEKVVLLVLAYRDNHDEPHGCFPSLVTVAKDCGLARSTVQTCLDDLVKSGLIKREQRTKDNGKLTTNYYSFPAVYRDAVHPIPPPGIALYRHPVREPKVLTVTERNIPSSQTDPDLSFKIFQRKWKHLTAGKSVPATDANKKLYGESLKQYGEDEILARAESWVPDQDSDWVKAQAAVWKFLKEEIHSVEIVTTPQHLANKPKETYELPAE